MSTFVLELRVYRCLSRCLLLNNSKGNKNNLLFVFSGSEPDAEEAVQLICETGGVAVLAHPWALKNPVAIIRRLKEAGLHGLEAYRSDGKLAAFSDLADSYNLLKLGGSDYHARGGNSESALGSVSLPVVAVHEFLKVARPIWCGAIKNTVDRYLSDPTDLNLDHILKYGSTKSGGHSIELIGQCLSQWLTNEEHKYFDFEAIRLKISDKEAAIESST